MTQRQNLTPEQATPRFANVSCSQCGRDFGPGDHGFSHCHNHPGPARDARIALALETFDSAREALRDFLQEYPAFRAKLGAPGSAARMEQDFRIALEDRARAVLAHMMIEGMKP